MESGSQPKINDNVRSLISRGIASFNKSDYVTAYSLFQDALKEEKNFDVLYDWLSRTAFRLARSDDTYNYAETLVKLNPKATNGYNLMGLVLITRKDYENSMPYFDRAIELDPLSPVYLDNRAVAYYSMKKYDKALEDDNKSLALKSDYPIARYNRARIYVALNKKPEAIEDLRQALKANPNYKDAKNLLGQISGMTIADDALKTGDLFLPSAETPKVNFSNVAGMDSLKKRLRESIIYPFQNPALAKKYGISAGGGILLYGPPGCGKTFIAKSIAGEAKIKFVQAKISELRSRWSGQTSKNINTIFEFARKNAPCILFFDEVDALGGSRDTASNSPWYREATNTFLTEMDGAGASNDGVLILGATNAPWIMDSALKRSGRFGSLVYVPPPDSTARIELFKLHLKDKPISEDIDYDKLSQLTNYYSAADIANMCTEAAKIPWEEALNTGKERNINMQDLITSISSKKSTIAEWYNNAKQIIKTGGSEDYTYSDLTTSIEEFDKSVGSGPANAYR